MLAFLVICEASGALHGAGTKASKSANVVYFPPYDGWRTHTFIMIAVAEVIGHLLRVSTLAKGKFEKRLRQNSQQCCVTGADRGAGVLLLCDDESGAALWAFGHLTVVTSA